MITVLWVMLAAVVATLALWLALRRSLRRYPLRPCPSCGGTGERWRPYRQCGRCHGTKQVRRLGTRGNR